jgi:hypothetical protein
MWVSYLAVYLLPIILYVINFVFMPWCIIKMIFYENRHKYSAREFSLMNKGYIYMVFNSIFLPGFTYTISLRFV